MWKTIIFYYKLNKDCAGWVWVATLPDRALSLLENKGYNPLSYRFMCLQSHYRNQLVFSYDSLDTAQSGYYKLKSKIKSLNSNEELDENKIKQYNDEFKDALKSDLNTSNALTCLFNVLKDNTINDSTKLYLIKEFDKVLSLNLIEENNEVSNELLNEINRLIEERNNAKNNKNYDLADSIRNKLNDMNVVIKDTREGTVFEIRR